MVKQKFLTEGIPRLKYADGSKTANNAGTAMKPEARLQRSNQVHVESCYQPATMNDTIDSAHALISRRCVNNCLFCATADKRTNREFPARDDIKRFIRKSHQTAVANMIFSGLGEPTLDPSFEDYLEVAGGLGFDTIRVFTNGYALTVEKASRWKKLGLTDVLLSIHGMESGHDASVRRSGAFNDVIRALQIYSQLDFIISINSCLTRKNLKEIRALVDFISTYPVRIHTLTFPEWSGNALKFHEDLVGYEELSAQALSLIPSGDNRTFFDNVPYCLVEMKTVELRGKGTVAYLDGKGESALRPNDSKLFHRYCHNGNCKFM